MKTHFCTAEKSIVSYEHECNWCGEQEMKIYTSQVDFLKSELRRLHEVNQMLVEALNLITFECGDLHHATKDRHGFEPCPVEARIYAAIKKAGEA